MNGGSGGSAAATGSAQGVGDLPDLDFGLVLEDIVTDGICDVAFEDIFRQMHVNETPQRQVGNA